jgi:hypothetical protein
MTPWQPTPYLFNGINLGPRVSFILPDPDHPSLSYFSPP